MMFTPIDFIRESNRIEGIHREPTQLEIDAYKQFMARTVISVGNLSQFVGVCQPGAVLRDKVGLDVRVGTYFPPKGGPHIRLALNQLLDDPTLTPYQRHCAYESLHPFTDGNGRSGRMLWMWDMKHAPLGFLHHWYYQSLDALSNRQLKGSCG